MQLLQFERAHRKEVSLDRVRWGVLERELELEWEKQRKQAAQVLPPAATGTASGMLPPNSPLT
jgi:hypothetical protein